MEYRQYSAEEGKVLLNLDTASWSNNCYCNIAKTINVISVTKEDGIYFNGRYSNSIQNAENEEDAIRAKNLFHEELVYKGYDLTKLIEPVIIYN